MKKILCILMLFLNLSISLAYAEKYINGVGENNEPFSFIDENTGKLTGFDIESMTWIANKMGFEVKHIPLPWGGIIYELATGEIDMICSGLIITDEGRKLINFSEPYVSRYNVFIVDKRVEIEYKDILSKNVKVGSLKGSRAAIEIAEDKNVNKYPFELLYYDNYSLIEEDLLKGKIDAAIMSAPFAQDIIARNAIIEIIAPHGPIDNYGVAFRKDDRSLGNMINEGYKLLKADPYWEELKSKYFEG